MGELLSWWKMHGSGITERVVSLLPPESAPRTRPEKCVKVPEQSMPAICTRSPVHLHRPVRPVPAPRTLPQVRFPSQVRPVPAPRTLLGVRVHSPVVLCLLILYVGWGVTVTRMGYCHVCHNDWTIKQ